jgi:hypothetical protein
MMACLEGERPREPFAQIYTSVKSASSYAVSFSRPVSVTR